MEQTCEAIGHPLSDLEPAEPDLREEYARFFFSLFEACLHEDAVGQREAHQQLEAVITRVKPAIAARAS